MELGVRDVVSGRAHALGRPLPPALRLVVVTTVDRWAPCAPRRCWGAVVCSSPAPLSHLHPGDVPSPACRPHSASARPGLAALGLRGCPVSTLGLGSSPGTGQFLPSSVRGLSWRPPGQGPGATGSKPQCQISPTWSCRGTAAPWVTTLRSATVRPSPSPHHHVPCHVLGSPSLSG